MEGGREGRGGKRWGGEGWGVTTGDGTTYFCTGEP